MSRPASDDEYNAVGEELTRRILALIPDHPEILEFESASGLLTIEAFEFADLAPSAFQAGYAWSKAVHLHKAKADA